MFFRAVSFATFYSSLHHIAGANNIPTTAQTIFAGGVTGFIISFVEVINSFRAYVLERVAEYLNSNALSLNRIIIWSNSIHYYQQTPIDLVKTKLQIQIFSTPTDSSSRSASVATIIRRQVTNHGILSLWQGFSATMIRNIPANAVFFPGNSLFFLP